jgi:hypothetical protein
MTVYSARAKPCLDAIALAAFTEERVRNWILTGTKHEATYHDVASLHELQRKRRPKTKQPFYVNYWCGRDKRCICRIEESTSLETDLMLFLKSNAGRTLGVHVEFKHPRERLSHGQAEGYPLQAACWCRGDYRPGTVIPHDDWLNVMFCADGELDGPALVSFDRRIGHDEAREMIAGYPGGTG